MQMNPGKIHELSKHSVGLLLYLGEGGRRRAKEAFTYGLQILWSANFL